ncbi:MAG: tRNA (N6-isopentenyl adenosine(37)-C2)-methylthiotransferase MiaB [Phycisphaerae bacterium]|nr:tRNA (N6-isopentenyl adenosine(37)-C2)-methylthiotransferase MiaB [Phycisphaerae bacterium]
MMRKIHLKSFGCQMNKLDSSLVAGALTEQGFALTDKPTEADVIIINTCSVRQHAENRVFSNLGHIKHLKKSRPEILVAVIGCMAQRLGAELLAHEVVDIVAGPTQLHEVPALIRQAMTDHEKHLSVTDKIRQPVADEKIIEAGHKLDDFEIAYDTDSNHIKSQAFIRAMRGCNNFCTYCIVPYVRGPEVSRPPNAIVEQAKKLAAQGIQQITLLGQTVNSYRYESPDKTYTLANLLQQISEIDKVHWVRFITSHPGRFDKSILQVMADNPKVCPYLHIPAQSGSDRILKAMNRGYTADHYIALIDKARAIVPDTAIAGDFIVGFPGETEDDFEQTVELVRRVRYKNAFVFKYSTRPGTHSEKKLEDSISAEVKQQRNTKLLEVISEIAEKDNQRFIGQTMEVLVEGLSKKPHLNVNAEANKNAGAQAPRIFHPQLIGRTAHDYIVVFNGPESLTGQFINVKITKTAPLTLFAELC